MADYEKQAREWRTREYIRQFRECKFPSGELEALAALLESVARDARAEERERCAGIAEEYGNKLQYPAWVARQTASNISTAIRAAGEGEKGAGN